MKKTTDFGHASQIFLTVHMPGTAGASPATIKSYRHSFIRFLEFMRSIHGILASDIRLSDLTFEHVKEFLAWLESYGNSASTRNQRQARNVQFRPFSYVRVPRLYGRIPANPFPALQEMLEGKNCLCQQDGIKAFLEQIDRGTREGLRDYVMFSLLYTVGLRVSELIGLRAKDVSLQKPCTLLVHGKGNKYRYVPVVEHIRPALLEYIDRNGLDKTERLGEWLFTSHTRK